MWPYWKPPPDPSRPNCPYLPGFTAEITSHVPPRPYLMGARNTDSPRKRRSGSTETEPLSEFVLANPPTETTRSDPTSLEEPNAKARLTVEKPIVLGNGHPGQVVRCKIEPIAPEKKPSFTAVARIYDALYYPFVSEIGGYAEDPCWKADHMYTCDANVYERLRKAGLTGDSAPEYYGSWTLTLPLTRERTGETHQRPVRLILIEDLNGTTIADLFLHNSYNFHAPKDGFHFPEAYRLDVMAQSLEHQTKLEYADVSFRCGLQMENVLLIDPTTTDSTVFPNGGRPRVVLVNYTNATIWEFSKWFQYIKKNPLSEYETTPNPMIRVWGSTFPYWEGWAPKDFHDDYPGVRSREWLWSVFGGENAARFATIKESDAEDSDNFSLAPNVPSRDLPSDQSNPPTPGASPGASPQLQATDQAAAEQQSVEMGDEDTTDGQTVVVQEREEEDGNPTVPTLSLASGKDEGGDEEGGMNQNGEALAKLA